MIPKDRAALRNLVIAVVASTAGLLAVGTTCLGRDRTGARLSDSAPSAPSAPTVGESPSIRSSAGGIPNDDAVGITETTSAQLDRGASATGSPVAAPTATATVTAAAADQQEPSAASPTPAAAMRPATTRRETMTTTAEPTERTEQGVADREGARAPGVAGAAGAPAGVAAGVAPTGSATAPLTSAQPATSASAAASARPLYRTPTQGLQGGAGGFMTEPSAFSASSLPTSPNPEAGAGPFQTDQTRPQ